MLNSYSLVLGVSRNVRYDVVSLDEGFPPVRRNKLIFHKTGFLIKWYDLGSISGGPMNLYLITEYLFPCAYIRCGAFWFPSEVDTFWYFVRLKGSERESWHSIMYVVMSWKMHELYLNFLINICATMLRYHTRCALYDRKFSLNVVHFGSHKLKNHS